MGKVLCPQCGCCFETSVLTESKKEDVPNPEAQVKKDKKPYLEWKESYSVGIELLDEQQKKLISIINDLHVTVSASRRDPAYIKQLIVNLSTYVKETLVVEEKMMRESSFPGLEKHSLEHRYFIKMIQELVEDYKKSVVSLRNVLAFLNNWFMKHVVEKDKDFAYYYARINKKAS